MPHLTRNTLAHMTCLMMILGCATPNAQGLSPKPQPNTGIASQTPTPSSTGNEAIRPSALPTNGPSASPNPTTPSLLTRTVSFQVYAPGAQGLSGKVVNEDPNGLLSEAGLTLVAQGGANLVAQGGGNLVAQGGANYRLMAAIDRLARVEKAVVYFRRLNGERLKIAGVASTDGSQSLTGVPNDEDLIAVSEYRFKGRKFRLEAMVPQGDLSAATIVIDPINTLVTARIKAIYEANGKKQTPLLLAQLKDAWTAFNEADIDVDPNLLESTRSVGDLLNFYAEGLKRITRSDQRNKVEAFMAGLATDSQRDGSLRR